MKPVKPEILYDKVYSWVLTVGPKLLVAVIVLVLGIWFIKLFYTVVITLDNRTVIIPNSKLSNEVIINISKLGKRRLDMEMKFSYGYDFEKIRSIIEKTLRASPLVESDPQPRIGVSALEL